MKIYILPSIVLFSFFFESAEFKISECIKSFVLIDPDANSEKISFAGEPIL